MDICCDTVECTSLTRLLVRCQWSWTCRRRPLARSSCGRNTFLTKLCHSNWTDVHECLSEEARITAATQARELRIQPPPTLHRTAAYRPSPVSHFCVTLTDNLMKGIAPNFMKLFVRTKNMVGTSTTAKPRSLITMCEKNGWKGNERRKHIVRHLRSRRRRFRTQVTKPQLRTLAYFHMFGERLKISLNTWYFCEFDEDGFEVCDW